MESMLNPKSDIVAAINIGSSKISAVVGRKNILGKLEILGYGKAVCEGVIRGVVSNIDKTAKAINDAVDMAEKMAKHEVHSVYVGIGGHHIKSIHHQGVLYRDHPTTEIIKEDLDRLIHDMYKIALPPGDQIIHVIPQEYFVDDQEGVLDPIGMSGSRLQSKFHIITGNSVASNNIIRALEKAGLEMAGLVLEPMATAQAVLSKEEKEAGVVLVDLGGGTTDVIIFHEGILRYASVVPIGAQVISKDIKVGCSVMMDQAEKLKIRFGSALSEEVVDNRIITIPGLMGRDPKEISEKNLARIIQARVEELFEYVMWDIRRSGFENQLFAGIVLTGGGSRLKNIELLAEYQTGLAARIGYPTQNLASHYEEELEHPMYASAIGLLQEGVQRIMPGLPIENNRTIPDIIELMEEPAELEEVLVDASMGDLGTNERKRGPNWLGSAVQKGYTTITKFFEPSPDSEF